MSQIYQQVASSSPSNENDVYIFSILPIADRGIAAITSADELLLLNRDSLRTVNSVKRSDIPRGLTSLVTADDGSTLICAGTDGQVAIFDLRTQNSAAQFKIGKPVNTLACRGQDLAIGSEAIVSVWDYRQGKIRWQNSENNDEITTLNFHPSQNNILMSGGDDGMVSIFDTHVAEEDDSLVQAINHGPIHKAGFLGPNDLYALSSDQNLALHSLTLNDDEPETPAPDQLGDLRPLIPCEYVIDILHSGLDHVVASGSHSKSQVDLVKIGRRSGLDSSQRISLVGAHGEEVVRSVFADEESGVIFTAGEDGRVAAFRAATDQSIVATPTKNSKSKKLSQGRYTPY